MYIYIRKRRNKYYNTNKLCGSSEAYNYFKG